MALRIFSCGIQSSGSQPQPGFKTLCCASKDCLEIQSGSIVLSIILGWISEIDKGAKGAETKKPEPVLDSIIPLAASLSYASTIVEIDRFRVLAKARTEGSREPVVNDRVLICSLICDTTKSIFVFLLLLILAVLTWQQLIKNNMYGAECVEKAEASKKSNFADQLKLLQQNAESVETTDESEGSASRSKEYNDIFGDQNLFKDFGGFDSDKKEESENGATRSNEYNDIFGDPNLFKNFGGFDNKE